LGGDVYDYNRLRLSLAARAATKPSISPESMSATSDRERGGFDEAPTCTVNQEKSIEKIMVAKSTIPQNDAHEATSHIWLQID
jgi:hypothetical protein